MSLRIAPLACFLAVLGCAQAQESRLALSNAALRVEIVPDWAGRMVFLGRPDGPNALFANPEDAAANTNAAGRRVWKNVGGNKTWVGEAEAAWQGFQDDPADGVWPPPAWFDAAPFAVVRADATNILMRSGVHTNAALGWAVAVEREFTLLPDRLVLHERLLSGTSLQAGNADCGRAPAGVPSVVTPRPDDPRRVWSNTQIPHVARIAIRRWGEGRWRLLRGCPAPVPRTDGSAWADLDVSDPPKHARIDADGDALAAKIPGIGWLLLEHSAPERHLGAFSTPSRAIVYATGFAATKPFVELEFVALGPDAGQTVVFRIVDALPGDAP
jgi:hypothetical protein